jgi:hypothetical protein
MPVVNFLACLDFEQNTLFLDRHYLSKSNNLITITFHLLGTEAFEKCFPPLAGFEFKSKIPDLERENAKILIRHRTLAD